MTLNISARGNHYIIPRQKKKKKVRHQKIIGIRLPRENRNSFIPSFLRQRPGSRAAHCCAHGQSEAAPASITAVIRSLWWPVYRNHLHFSVLDLTNRGSMERFSSTAARPESACTEWVSSLLPPRGCRCWFAPHFGKPCVLQAGVGFVANKSPVYHTHTYSH